MKENNVTRMAVCPRCGKTYFERPTLSKIDNEALICPDCGTREMLEGIGVSVDEQDSIIETIYRTTRNPR